MRIKLEVSGGFGGLLRGCDLDVDALPASAAQALRGLADAAGLQESFSRHDRNARDALLYELAVERRSGKAFSASFDEPSMPVAYAPLIEGLEPYLAPLPRR